VNIANGFLLERITVLQREIQKSGEEVIMATIACGHSPRSMDDACTADLLSP
jgi:hypothetical protein